MSKLNPFGWYGVFEINGIYYNVMELPDYTVDSSGKEFPHKWDAENSRWILLTEEEKKIAKQQ